MKPTRRIFKEILAQRIHELDGYIDGLVYITAIWVTWTSINKVSVLFNRLTCANIAAASSHTRKQREGWHILYSDHDVPFQRLPLTHVVITMGMADPPGVTGKGPKGRGPGQHGETLVHQQTPAGTRGRSVRVPIIGCLPMRLMSNSINIMRTA